MTALGTDILTTFRPNRAKPPNSRQKIILGAVLLSFALLCFRTISLGTTGGKRARNPAQGFGPDVSRADIVDRNGEILAKNVYRYDLVMNARQIKDPDAAAAFVRGVFPDISANDVLAKIRTGKGYVELRKNIGKNAAQKVRDEKMEGISVILKQTRKYPKHNSMSHVVGFVNKDGVGIEGIEKIENERLIKDPAPLRLSIDSRIQSGMWTALSEAMREYKAKFAIGILMNSRTGEILAAAQLPDFDPENIGDYKTENRKFRLIRDNYEIGSIFKIFNTALALSYGIPITKTYNVVDPFLVGGKKIEEARGFKPPAKNLNIAQIMQYSCNSGSAQIALSMPDNSQLDFFRELYFDRPLETDLGRTERPLFPQSDTPTDRSRWAFGHGIAVSPLHAFLAANAIANDGRYVMPTIHIRNFVPQTKKIVPPETSSQIRQILYKIGDTSAKLAVMQVHGMNIGGKTSTAQKFINGKYSDTKNLTSFFTTFPIEAPKWSLMIIFDEPESAPRTAAYNAVPTAGKILDAIIPLL